MSGTKNAELVAGQRRFKPYPAYKDSGIEWLGEIPAHWEWQRLRYACRRITDGSHHSPPAVIDGLPYVTVQDLIDGRVDVDNAARISEDDFRSLDRNGCRPRIGDVLFSKDGTVGKVALVDCDDFVVLSSLAILQPAACLESPFLFQFLRSAPGVSQIESRFAGAALRRITLDAIVDLVASIPPLTEQRAIAAFLDRETVRIDALVAKKERLIELLHEKRTALITRAVTKGLDSNVSMKDSGVEWLGEIPAHWEVAALKHKARRIQTGSTPPTTVSHYYEEGTVAWYGPGSFSDDLPLKTPVKLISESSVRDGVARVFEAGSCVIVTIGATIGKVAYMEIAGSCNQQITGVSFDLDLVFPRYGAYQLKRLEPVLRGIAPNTTLPILGQEEIGYLPFVMPPRAEQQSISAFLDRETAKIDALSAKVRKVIDRLKELRTALISAAVTGKIDVREEAA